MDIGIKETHCKTFLISSPSVQTKPYSKEDLKSAYWYPGLYISIKQYC